MFWKAKKLTNEDKINLMAGFLPQEDQILQIIPATGFNAEFRKLKGDDLIVPLLAWAFLKNGAVLPLCYDHPNKSHVSVHTIKGFTRIVHDNDLEEDEEDDTYKL